MPEFDKLMMMVAHPLPNLWIDRDEQRNSGDRFLQTEHCSLKLCMNRSSKKETCKCGGKMTRTTVSRTIPLAGRQVRVENIKASVCADCGETYLDGPSLLKIESKLLKQPVLAKT